MSTSTQHMSSWNQWTRERERNQQWLNDRLHDIDYPALFMGDEMNTFHFDWDKAIADGRIDATWRVALMSMKASWSSLGSPALTLFYEQLHDYNPSWVIERSVCPPTKHTLELMKSDGINPFAVESKMPLTAFDVLCLSMETLSDAVTIPWTIMESGIPLHALDRNDTDPFCIPTTIWTCDGIWWNRVGVPAGAHVLREHGGHDAAEPRLVRHHLRRSRQFPAHQETSGASLLGPMRAGHRFCSNRNRCNNHRTRLRLQRL